MEDAHRIAFDLKNHKDSAFFGVFDGHAGTLTSDYKSLFKSLIILA